MPWGDAARWVPAPVWRLPVMTSDLRADWSAAMAAHRAAVEPWQERACLLRISQLARRQAEVDRDQVRGFVRGVGEAGARIGEVFLGLAGALTEAWRPIGQAEQTQLDFRLTGN